MAGETISELSIETKATRDQLGDLRKRAVEIAKLVLPPYRDHECEGCNNGRRAAIFIAEEEGR